jgi:hypothetical protein
MANLIRISLLVILSATIVFSQSNSKDLSQVPTEFNNPLITTTPIDGVTSTLSESFEDVTFPPAGWSVLSPDGGTGWTRLTAGTTPFPGWNGGTVIAPTGGGNAVAFATYTTGGATYNNQWLVTPQITDVQTGDELSFWMWFPFSSYADSVDVLISTTGINPGDFNIIVDQFYLPVGSADTSWAQHTYTLSNFVTAGSNIYIAWREHVADNLNDGAIVCLDLVEVTGGGPLCVFMDNFEAGLGNWIITNEGNIPCVWDTITLASRSYTLPPEAVGLGMAADIDFCGSSGDSLYSTATMANGINASDYSTVIVEFDNDWRILDAADQAYLEMSVNGGTTWTEVASWLGIENRNTHEIWDVSAAAGLMSDVRFRLRSVQPGWDWWWVVDNFAIYLDDFIPVELTSFAATVNEREITLHWSTATETNNLGFDIERSTGSVFQKVGYVAGFGTSTETHNYSFVDGSLNKGNYSYRLKQVDYDGSFEYSDVVEVVVTVPDVYSLQQNYPNPFNPGTTIDFSLAVNSNVKLTVFNILGQEVVNLVNGNLPAGQKSIKFDASNLNSGVYFYKVEATGIDGTSFSSIKKMILMK